MTERLLTARQLAELLGYSPATVVDWFERGEVPGFRIGGRLRFRLSEVEAWLEQDCRGKARPVFLSNGDLTPSQAFAKKSPGSSSEAIF